MRVSWTCPIGKMPMGCGGDVAACMGYIYGGMGWISVAYWIGSAFVPEVVVAAAADCAVHNCL